MHNKSEFIVYELGKMHSISKILCFLYTGAEMHFTSKPNDIKLCGIGEANTNEKIGGRKCLKKTKT